MPQKIDFKTWWNEKYFYADGHYRPLHNVYAKLHKAGADLDNVETFSNCLRYGDTVLASLLALATPARKYQRIKHNFPLTMRLGEALALETEVESLKKRRDEIINETLSKIVESMQEMRQRFEKSALLPAMEEFHLPDIFQSHFSRGRKPDLWGSFFLLAVTEHMKSVVGKPSYRLADELLRAVRRLHQARLPSLLYLKNSTTRLNGKCNAAVRISKLKKTHPNWAIVLRCINSRKSYFPDQPHESFLLRFVTLEFGRRGIQVAAKRPLLDDDARLKG
jgi:hypothetical protein